MGELLDDLKQNIAAGEVVVVVGCGVSMAVTNGNDISIWGGMLRHGVERCCEVVSGLDDKWKQRVLDETRSDLDDMLSAAEKVSRKLNAPDGGEFSRWLRDSVGSLEALSPGLLEAIQGLGAPIATTNYDDLIENVTGRRPITWTQSNLAVRFLRGNEPEKVLHLHGHWEEPGSVVLGIRSYESVLGQEAAQALLRALRMTRTLLFIGFGEGLHDPNFGALLEWTRRELAGDHYRHFRLARTSEVAELQKKHPPEERLFVIPYGDDYSDLEPFIRSLGSRRPTPSSSSGGGAGGGAPASGGSTSGAAGPVSGSLPPSSSAVSKKTQQYREIEELLQEVQDTSRSLATTAAKALALARKLGETEFASFLTSEIGGYGSHVMSVRDPRYPNHRVMKAFCSIARRINTQFMGWGESASNVFAYMENDENFFPVSVIVPEPLAALEELAADAQRGQNLQRGLMSWQSTVADMFPNTDRGKIPADAPVFCYARADAQVRVVRAVRAEISSRLLALLPEVGLGEPSTSTKGSWQALVGKLVALSPLHGLVGVPADDQFRVVEVSDTAVKLEKLSNQQSLSLPLFALSDPWDVDARVPKAAVREGRLAFDPGDEHWKWRPIA